MKTTKILLNNIRLRYSQLKVMALLVISVIFVMSQILGVFKYPVNDDSDIAFLQSHGERDYLYKEATDEEQQVLAVEYLKNIISTENVDAEKLNTAIDVIETKGLSTAIELYQSDNYVSPWLNIAVSSSKQQLLSPAEINDNILMRTSGYGYQQNFQNKYITYGSAILGFLLIALAYFFIKTDDNIHSRDLYSHLVGGKNKYFRLQFLTLTLPVLVSFYIIGCGINLFSYFRFHNAGLPITYLPFSIKFLTFFVPNIMIFAGVSAAMMIAFEKSNQVIPVYLLWCVMNITPQATRINGVFEKLFFFKRLDFTNIIITDNLIVAQVIGVTVSILIFEAALMIRKRKEA